MCGLLREKFPELKRAVDILGPIKKEVAHELGLREDIPILLHNMATLPSAIPDRYFIANEQVEPVSRQPVAG